jgi:menaquinone-9 beta-reductase
MSGADGERWRDDDHGGVTMQACDVVVVGGGIGGAALAKALAADGLDVVVLEASIEYQDRVRGESLMPWGVAEARALDVEEVLLAAGAHVAPAWLHYDAVVPTEVTAANPIPVGFMVPDVAGTLNLRHPDACAALAAAAVAAGATVLRGVTDVKVAPGPDPTVAFTSVGGERVELAARLVVGADGRASVVRRQVGIPLHRQAEVHMIAGLLVDGLEDVPDDADFLAGDGDLFMAAFHQGGGRLRIYLCPGLAQRHRFSGPGGVDEFLAASAFGCLPFGDQLARSKPAGPIATYPGDESWVEHPAVDGVVLVGDAAGWNNPVIGQGLSITLRDARMVRDVVRGGDLRPAAFGPYACERVERMRRLRYCADFIGAAHAEDCDDRTARRRRFFELRDDEPLTLGMLIAIYGGPESAPVEAFDGSLLAAIRAS